MPQNPDKLPPAEQIAHYNAILVEDLSSKFKLVLEKMSDFETRINHRVDERFNQLSARLDLHDLCFEENNRRWAQNERRWEESEKLWAENEKRWEECMRYLYRIDERLDTHEGRLAVGHL